ncbi:MAG: FAD synthetase [Natronomonas sp.]|jgi:FAD synthetase|uniref:adenylyltransferase/cytidyltransferase family protein n=1 Tax=Natronomonas sp. TaxID=2184060 RepID=UPI00398A20FF
MKRVVAQGTFDLLHPGHLHYLETAKSMGGELHVIIARSENVTHKEKPVISDRQRRDMVAALDPVDEARLGHIGDFFVPIRDIDPDIIVLGHDQHHDEETLAAMLEEEGIDCAVARASAREPEYDGEVLSTGRIIDRVCDRRC